VSITLRDDTIQDDGWQRSGDVRLKWMDMLAEFAPEYLDAWKDWGKRTTDITELDPKAREFLIVAIDSVIPWPSPYIDSHIHKGFNHGATVREFVEVAITCAHLMGPHPANHLLTALYKCIKEREELGLETPRTRAELDKG
jgi:alkylhydroperoxidase/carboxymuconolactone decarboxylase family protein YurZ